MPTYNKLVRDRIPDIIAAQGKRAVIRVLSPQEWLAALRAKLQEEVDEYRAAPSLEELADVVEVIHGLLAAEGVSWARLEEVRLKKRQHRGGFERRLCLVEADP